MSLRQQDFDIDLKRLRFKPEECKFVEIWTYQNDPKPHVITGVLHEEDFATWLPRAPGKQNGQYPVNGFRIIVGNDLMPRNVEVRPLVWVPFTRPTFLSIMEAFHLPLCLPQAIRNNHPFFARFDNSDCMGDSGVTGFSFRTMDYPRARCVYACSYNPKTRVTLGLLLGLTPNEGDLVAIQLAQQAALAWHPMLVPLTMMDIATKWNRQRTTTLGTELWAIQRTVGHQWNIRETDVIDYTSLDLLNITRKLNVTSMKLGFASRRTGELLQLAKGIEESVERVQLVTSEAGSDHSVLLASAVGANDLERTGDVIRTKAIYSRSLNENAVFGISHDQNRIQTQLAVVYSYTAQRDNKLSIQIAEGSKIITLASKRDSASMMSIAVLQMVFLPGTFMAAFFAMPLLDWTGQTVNSPTITTPGFWIYWAITVPMTVLVFVIWYGWTRWKRRQEAEEDEEARVGTTTRRSTEAGVEGTSMLNGLMGFRKGTKSRKEGSDPDTKNVRPRGTWWTWWARVRAAPSPGRTSNREAHNGTARWETSGTNDGTDLNGVIEGNVAATRQGLKDEGGKAGATDNRAQVERHIPIPPRPTRPPPPPPPRLSNTGSGPVRNNSAVTSSIIELAPLKEQDTAVENRLLHAAGDVEATRRTTESE